ncbi:MAG: response regulator [Balneolaceae bacterium]
MDIYIVEDDKVLTLILTKMLEKLNCNVAGLSDTGKDAIETILTKRPPVILMDIFLKDEISGIDVSEEITSHYSPYIIYITGNSDKANKERASKIGFHDYLIKPVTLDMLQKTIDSLPSRNGTTETP